MTTSIFKTDDTLSQMILRICLAGVVLPHGYLKITDFSNTMDHLTLDYGLPWIIGVFVILIEFFAPLFLLPGVASKVMAFLIATLMAGAIPFHWSNGFFMNWFGSQGGEGIEFHLLALGIAFAIMIKGGGKHAVDKMLYQEKQ